MAVDMFLKLDGIDGESNDSKHKGEIDVLSYSWGVSQPVSGGGGGGGAGKPVVTDFQIVKVIDKASPHLMEACCSGKHIPSAQLSLASRGKGGQQEFLVIKMSDILVSSYQTGGGGGAGAVVPSDSFSLNFQKVEFMVLDEKGGISEVSCNFFKDANTIGHEHD